MDNIKVVLGKSVLDSHDRGGRYIARKFREAGMEVVYTTFLMPEEVVNVALQEDANVLAISSSSEGHISLMSDILQRLKQKGLEKILIILGGVIPSADFPKLLDIGVSGIFTSGKSAQEAVDFIKANVRGNVSSYGSGVITLEGKK